MDELIEQPVWVIQRCIDIESKHYENLPDFCDTFMTQTELAAILEECIAKWPNQVFRGHNIHYSLINNPI